MSLIILSPSPVPVTSSSSLWNGLFGAVVEKKASKIRSSYSGAIPSPLSENSTNIVVSFSLPAEINISGLDYETCFTLPEEARVDANPFWVGASGLRPSSQ